MHDYILRSLVDQHRHHLTAEAEAHRQVKAARVVARATPAPTAADAILANATLLKVRPIDGEDTARLMRLFARLSPRSIHRRFFAPIAELSTAQLARMVDVDHQRREALVALSNDEIVAVARYDGSKRLREAELAVTVEDTWQRRGIGKRLTGHLSTLAIARGFEAFVADILRDNDAALGLVRSLSSDASIRCNHDACQATIPLVPS